ncbi:hypothetical protein [Bradyrhizobium sp. Ghvi]|uniref:hypothetical protein n=1 Tax=Bradyrhizobium sp. Ghvi TaxID=1855319 RepID=UPI001FCD74BB|nr:hypothetical protein [Bradyrhizobium sp. Ghvi]
MNIDRWNAADASIDSHDALPQPHQADRQSDELSVQASSPVRPSIDHEDFEDQLQGLHSVHQTSDPAIESSSASSEAVPQTNHYPAASFVSARDQLAATLTGATLGALKNEIALPHSNQHDGPQQPRCGTRVSIGTAFLRM